MEEMKELKNVMKSVRITETEYGIVMKYRGRNFNEKLENILLDSGERKEKQVIKDMQEIDKLYMQRQSLQEEVEHLLDIKDSLNQLVFAASHLNEKLKDQYVRQA